MSLSNAKDLATIIGVFVALVTFIKSAVEYTKQGAQKRAEQFQAMRLRFKDDERFAKIADLLETDSNELKEIPFSHKRDYLGFFEEVALLLNSGIMRRQVAHYMFGYYAIRCWESKNFWTEVNRDSVYWAAFRIFAEQMKEVEGAFRYSTRKFRV